MLAGGQWKPRKSGTAWRRSLQAWEGGHLESQDRYNLHHHSLTTPHPPKAWTEPFTKALMEVGGREEGAPTPWESLVAAVSVGHTVGAPQWTWVSSLGGNSQILKKQRPGGSMESVLTTSRWPRVAAEGSDSAGCEG